MSAWLDIIGIGEDGVDGLSKDARAALEQAEIIIGGDRHHGLTDNIKAERLSWPSPFDAMIDVIKGHKGKKLVMLVTGDPLWFSVGARILKSISAEEIRFHPQLSAFQWAACRMGWSLADCETVTVHGRPAEQIIPHFAPKVRLLILTKDKTSPAEVAKLLKDRGFGQSRMSVLAALGGKHEKRFDGAAGSWDHEVPDFHTLAVECIADENAKNFSRVGGLPDDAFEHDGQLTKRAVRAATVSALQPYPDALLWDIGAGCGSVSIEWMRAARGAKAIAIEKSKDRLAMMEQNTVALGVPRLEMIEGSAPEALNKLSRPDAIFIGGGITNDKLFESAWEALRAGGRMVANVVTMEGESRVYELHTKYGGSLEKITVSESVGVGKFNAMKPMMSVTQWSVVKSMEAAL